MNNFIKRLIFLCLSYLHVDAKEILPYSDSLLMSEQELLNLVQESKKDDELLLRDYEPDMSESRSFKKPLTFMVFIAADNDLHYFAWKNIKQMEAIGSNNNINIVIQLNTPGHLNPTKRYFIKQGRRVLVQEQATINQKLNSGSPQTLIDFVKWAKTYYPADEYALVLWNHGTGAIDPGYVRTINPCELFYCNPSNNMLEIDRGLSYISLILQYAKDEQLKPKRGMCFDETFKSYINNHDFEFALQEICTKVLEKKLAIIAFDACLMSMIEVASAAKKYAQYMVGSQEVEYGTGWNYETVLKPFLTKSLSSYEFAQHIVTAYEQAYYKITNEYTQSALNLTLCQELETNINTVAKLLIEAFAETRSQTINILRKCKSTQHCTCFDEPSYIDLGHFYKNLSQHLQYLTLPDKNKEQLLQQNLKTALSEGLEIIKAFVIANKTGQKLKGAQGISIYFPEHTLLQSYLKSTFALHNSWSALLAKYIFG